MDMGIRTLGTSNLRGEQWLVGWLLTLFFSYPSSVGYPTITLNLRPLKTQVRDGRVAVGWQLRSTFNLSVPTI